MGKKKKNVHSVSFGSNPYKQFCIWFAVLVKGKLIDSCRNYCNISRHYNNAIQTYVSGIILFLLASVFKLGRDIKRDACAEAAQALHYVSRLRGIQILPLFMSLLTPHLSCLLFFHFTWPTSKSGANLPHNNNVVCLKRPFGHAPHWQRLQYSFNQNSSVRSTECRKQSALDLRKQECIVAASCKCLLGKNLNSHACITFFIPLFVYFLLSVFTPSNYYAVIIYVLFSLVCIAVVAVRRFS